MSSEVHTQIIRDADYKVKGTEDYNKYKMTLETKINGRWKFMGWYTPRQETATIKKVNDTIYLMPDRETRYLVTEAIKELLKL